MRINIFGPPCAAKSTTAAKLFSRLKEDNFNVELVTEYIKSWTYIKREPKSFDQIYIFGQQLHKEDVALNAGFEHIITDCPLLLNCFYAKYNNLPGCKQLLEIAKEFEDKYSSLNIYLPKIHRNYSSIGRFHNEEQIEEIDVALKQFLDEQKISIAYMYVF
jgi:hypothetical protein